MTTIRWTESARADLRAIHAYVSRDSQIYARRLVEKIKHSVARLRRFPRSGGMVLEWEKEDVREIPVGNYRVIYRLQDNRVIVLTVIHAARQLPDLPPVS